MKIKILLTVCLVVLGLSVQAKEYKYRTVEGDLTEAHLYTGQRTEGISLCQ